MAQSKGHCGLKNEGSTCYLNAVLQTLFMTKEFKEHVKSDLSSDNFIKALKELFSELEKQEETEVSAAEVRKSLGITDVQKQGDAAEILHLIIKTLTLIKKTPEYSEFFKGSINTTRTCRCKDEQPHSEDFLSLIVSFKENQDVEAAIKAHIDGLCQKYTLNCADCNVTTVKKTEMINFPKILIVQLRRFEMDSSGQGYCKNALKVNIRPHIKVSSHKYDLYAIINHYGKYKAGHYNADIKCEDEIWRRFNDESVSDEFTCSFMNSIFTDKDFTLRSSNAYLLVYRRRE